MRVRLFKVQADFSVQAKLPGFDVIGSGISVGLGSLHSTKGAEPRLRVHAALQAAEAFTTTVRGPFTIEELRG